MARYRLAINGSEQTIEAWEPDPPARANVFRAPAIRESARSFKGGP
jgi:hypothetical protein